MLSSTDIQIIIQKLDAFEKRVDLKFEQIDKKFELIDKRFEMVFERLELLQNILLKTNKRLDMEIMRHDKRIAILDRNFKHQQKQLNEQIKNNKMIEDRMTNGGKAFLNIP